MRASLVPEPGCALGSNWGSGGATPPIDPPAARTTALALVDSPSRTPRCCVACSASVEFPHGLGGVSRDGDARAASGLEDGDALIVVEGGLEFHGVRHNHRRRRAR